MITIIPQLPALFISDELCYTENIARIDTMVDLVYSIPVFPSTQNTAFIFACN